MVVKTPDSERWLCDQCGAPIARHAGHGLCSRCVARFSLLEATEEPGEGVLEPSSAASNQGLGGENSERRDPGSRTRFGDYELLEEIARGGMGVVYRARQLSLNRVVAVKMVLFGQFAGKHAFERFRAEAETIARLQHPNIVAIHEIGETDGQPYFSMDYVAGRSLAERVGDRPMPARQAAEYVRKIALAVHYAHTQGVLHRDLKPANVLLDEADEPHITDFGLARRLAGDSELTLTGQVVGSPNFMPPEQGLGKKVKLGPACDVYGLGAMLYYLVTARAPFVADSLGATLSQVLNDEPVTPRQLNPALPLDLEVICLKCLEKDPARRYASAAHLAHELECFLQGKSIQARPLGSVGKLWRWCRRKPAVAAMLGAILLLLLAATGISVAAARNSERKARELRLNLYVADMNVVQQALLRGDLGRARDLLNTHRPTLSEHEGRGFEWRLFWQQARGDQLYYLRGHTDMVNELTFSPDGSLLASASSDRSIRLWDLRQGKPLRVLHVGPTGMGSVVFSPNGELLAFADQKSEICVWDRQTEKRLISVPAPGARLAFSPDSRMLAAGCALGNRLFHRGGDLVVVDSHSGHRILQQPGAGFLVTFSADGRFMASGQSNGCVFIWDTASMRVIKTVAALENDRLTSVALSPDGYELLAGSWWGKTKIWDTQSGGLLHDLGQQPGIVTGAAYSSKAGLWATSSSDMRLRLWDNRRLDFRRDLIGHGTLITCLAAFPLGPELASGDQDGTICVWRGDAAPEAHTLTNRCVGGGPYPSLVYSPDGRQLAVSSFEGGVSLCEVSSLRYRVLSTNGHPLAFSHDGQHIYSASDAMVSMLEISTGAQVRQQTFEMEGAVPMGFLLSPDQRILAGVSPQGRLVLWEFSSGRQLMDCIAHESISRLAFSPDSSLLVTVSEDDHQAKVWRIPSPKPRIVSNHRVGVNSVGFSRDGKLLATGGLDSRLKLLDTQTWKEIATLHSSKEAVTGIDFAPDGKTLAFIANEGMIKLCCVQTLREVALFSNERMTGGFTYKELSFAPDGSSLAAVQKDGTVRIWRAPSFAEINAAESPQASAVTLPRSMK